MSPSSAGNKQVVDEVASATGWSTKESRQAVQSTFAAVAKLLKKNDRVSITGVGSFAKTVKPASKGGQKAKNPFTGEEYITKAKPKKTRVRFRPGRGFNEQLGAK